MVVSKGGIDPDQIVGPLNGVRRQRETGEALVGAAISQLSLPYRPLTSPKLTYGAGTKCQKRLTFRIGSVRARKIID